MRTRDEEEFNKSKNDITFFWAAKLGMKSKNDFNFQTPLENLENSGKFRSHKQEQKLIYWGKGWEILKWGKGGWDDCCKVWAILRISHRICWDFRVKKQTRMGSGVGLVLLLWLLGCRRKGEEEVKLGRLYVLYC
ncbi:hypothetical protein H5410_045414 [Solanum commersonii]|uniref:Uncharacterized protein n=1 Tax=Solanum commersonii TaxID=4109 RepID=A0A9J5XCN9_SOLCO|nr:hypothetical protein H5410_045414 [Solanum commersonii]